MEPLEVLRNALARTREYLAGKCRPLQQSLLPHKSKFFLKALSLLTFWIPAFAGMTNTGKCSIARHARAGGHPGCLPEALGCKKPTPERSPILLAALLSVLLSPGTPLAVVATPPPASVLQLGGTSPGYFGRTFGVALDTSGTIYVADHENRRIQKFDAQGNFLNQFPVATNPFALTIANGTVYVAGENGGGDRDNLLEYDQAGHFIRGFGGSGVAFLNVAVDPVSNVYVVEASHGNVLKFAPDGTLLTNSFGGNRGNEAVATDGNYIYITSCVPGDAAYPLQKYDFNGNRIAQWGTASQFNCAGGLAIDSIGDVHIADTNRHRILTFTNNGTLLDQTGSLGQGNGQFYYPWELATDAAGHTYVADTENSRVQILDSNLNFVTAFGQSTLYGFYNAVGVSSTPDGNIYIADFIFGGGGRGRFSTFDSQGNLTFRREFADVLPPTANWPPPTSLAVGKDGSIYVDFSGNTPHTCSTPVVAKFDSQLNFIGAASGPGCSGGPPSAGMTIDVLGLLYLVAGSTVDIYDGNLNQTGTFQVTGTLGHTVGTTDSIAVDSQGIIYVTTGSDLGIYDGPGNQIGFFPLSGANLAAAPDRSLFVANPINDTLAIYPSALTNAQLIWNLPYTPDGVFVDQSKVYVVGGGSGGTVNPGGAAVNPVSVFVYSNLFTSSVTPPIGGDTGAVTVAISGRGFQQGATAVLRRPGQADITASTIGFTPDGTSATAQFNLAGAADGLWDVVVTNPDGTSASLAAGFTIEPGEGPVMWVDIVGPSLFRSGQPASFSILVGNGGDTDGAGQVLIAGIPIGSVVNLELPWLPAGTDPFDYYGGVVQQIEVTGEIVLVLHDMVVPPGSTAIAGKLVITVPDGVSSFELLADLRDA